MDGSVRPQHSVPSMDTKPVKGKKGGAKKELLLPWSFLFHSGQTETVSVRFRPKISTCFGFGFGISVFQPKQAISAEKVIQPK